MQLASIEIETNIDHGWWKNGCLFSQFSHFFFPLCWRARLPELPKYFWRDYPQIMESFPLFGILLREPRLLLFLLPRCNTVSSVTFLTETNDDKIAHHEQ